MKVCRVFEWMKVIHILAVISWMAGLFYLPRLFVYHSESVPGGESDCTFKIMERRLLVAIMRPALVVTLASGAGLVHVLGLSLGTAWLVLKFGAVVLLVLFHGLLEWHCARFREGHQTFSERYFRLINEVPTILLIVIVIAVVVRPFS
jgi:protoporphyrinogen IX oxidase